MLRRLSWLLPLALLLATIGARPAAAQKHDNPGWVYLPAVADGTTVCVPGGVRSVIDMRVTDDPADLEATIMHEAVHQRQLKADRKLCHPSERQLLDMETEAYCEADVPVLTEWIHVEPMALYRAIQDVLLGQFFKSGIPAEQVVRAWHERCGRQLGVP